MARFTGIKGTVKKDNNEVTPILDWDITITNELKEYHDNTCGKAKRRTASLEDCSGTITVMLDTVLQMPFTEGETYDLELHADDSGRNYIAVPVKFESFQTTTSINAPDNLVVKFAFKGDGEAVKYGCYALTGSTGSSSD